MRAVPRGRAAFLSVLALVLVAGCSGAGETPATSCADNCPNGCCDVRGVCRPGNTPDNCGTGGASCGLCQSGQSCQRGACVADCASTCDGCCDALDRCQQSSNQSCGIEGAACVTCLPGTRCQRGLCESDLPTCGPSTCAGCCRGNECVEPGNTPKACGSGGRLCARCADDHQCIGGRCQADACDLCLADDKCCFEGRCFPGDTFGLCGKPGAACKSCQAGQLCDDGACVDAPCDAEHCGGGCCDDQGKCHLPGPADPAACGTGGATCKACGDGQLCKEGTCEDPPPPTCDPLQCDGCCDGGTCVPGDGQSACGKDGACVSCGSSQQCVDHKCTCTTASCEGCCDGDVCRGGQDNDACGKSGAACDQCTGLESCTTGACVEICDETTCATGCCDGTVCNHAGAGDADKCGVGGVACQGCDQPGGEKCLDGTCVNPIACGPGGVDTCASGCCDGDQCKPGTADDACGLLGAACAQCPSWGICEDFGSDRACDASDTSSWSVTLSKVELDPSIEWDGNGPPDVFVEVTVDGQTKTSSTVNDTYTPVFNELLLTATGKALKTEIKYVIYDDDLWPLSNTKILECSDVIYADEFVAGFAEISFPCGNASSNPVKLIRFEIAPLTSI